MLEGFLFYYNFVSADSCGFARRGGTRSSEGRFPSSRSSPPGHAAVPCCGMCYFSDGAMDSTVLDIVGCADISN